METAGLSTRSRMLELIINSPDGVTKKEIYEKMHISMPTVHRYVAELLKLNLIQAGAAKPSTGGRPAAPYLVVPRCRFSIGVFVSAGHHRLLALDLTGRELAYKKIRKIFTSIDDLAALLAEELPVFISENGLLPDALLGVCISVPSTIDRIKEELILSPTLNLRAASYKALMQLPYPMYIENDTVCAASAQLPADDFVYLLLEQGIGGAICIDGKIIHGKNDKGAEFGHMCIVPNGKRCNCGKNGCLEAYLSSRRFKQELAMDTSEFFMHLKSGDEACEKIWDEMLFHLAVAINNLRMAFDSDIILGGTVAEGIVNNLDYLKDLVKSLNPFGEESDYIYIADNPSHANMVGAAMYFILKFIAEL